MLMVERVMMSRCCCCRDARTKNVSEYLKDYTLMLKTPALWRDGNAMMGWILGTSYYSSDPKGHRAGHGTRKKSRMTAEDVAAVELWEKSKRIDDNARELAAKRLREIFYFGFLDYKLDASLRLLQEQTGLTWLPTLEKKNVAWKPRPKLSTLQTRKSTKELEMERVHAKLADLKPNDVWFYNYAKDLFDARINGAAPCDYPPTPPMPTVLCTATAYRLRCDPTSAMGRVDYTAKTMGLANLEPIPEALVTMIETLVPRFDDQ